MKTRLLAAVCFAAVMACTAFADVRLPKIFDNNMVLQRDMPVPIWGWADPGEEVIVTFEIPGIVRKLFVNDPVIASPDGKWSTILPQLDATAESCTLTVKGKNEIKLTNILVGDVWLCSGQSNMEWSIAGTEAKEKEEALKTADNPNIRLFQVTKVFSPDPKEELTVASSWKPASAATIQNFSAVGYHFGKKLQAELDVPIGLINSSWGGTRIEPWIPPVGFENLPELKYFVDFLKTPNPKNDQQQPTMLYNAMIHPFVPFAIKGAIWYQGESNMGEGMLYAEKMKALIQGWRKVFDNPDLGFYYVQLAPYFYGDQPTRLPEFWEAQSSVEKAVSKTGQAVINDLVDNIRDIHPQRKQQVGERLALLALNRTYGKNELVAASPEFESFDTGTNPDSEHEWVAVKFKNAKSLKTRDGKTPDSFEIAGADGVYHKADAHFIGDVPFIVLKSDNVPKPVAVRYAWDQSAQPNVVNEAGLPLGAFRAGTIEKK